ncbi:aldose 1-epimerase [Mangrovibacter plantisponsor]|uniref:Aldose 1-epimerase n=1 Tax=Mangrovibacter plantisponsor TaxID=451513 RepID=A0A317Q6T1_9ENTR|nr:aldose 1-epimerase [Mangrovibacter plantisponsor]PWW10992.1 aldose 1-epimerase [Mangrovibacter plantisponsor]
MANYTIENPCLRARITDNGACLLSLECLGNGGHILRQWLVKDIWHPAESAMFPMLPFANRIAGNCFSVRDKIYTLPQSPFNDPYYLHGNGWLTQWRLLEIKDSYIILRSQPAPIGIYYYIADIEYRLIDNQFTAKITLIHLGKQAAPYGAGFHPFFQTSLDDTVQFSSTGYWSENEFHLADEWHEEIPGYMNFSQPRVPSAKWINNCYSGWNGVAQITNRLRKITLSSDLPWLMVYQNGNDNFVCLEPQSHQVNAHNIPGRPGLRMLKQGDSYSIDMSIKIVALPQY